MGHSGDHCAITPDEAWQATEPVDFHVGAEKGETIVQVLDRDTRHVLATMRGPEVMTALRAIIALQFDSRAVNTLTSGAAWYGNRCDTCGAGPKDPCVPGNTRCATGCDCPTCLGLVRPNPEGA